MQAYAVEKAKQEARRRGHSTTEQTLGFTGSSCRDASRFIEQALGQRTGEKLTAEFHQRQSAEAEHQQRLGRTLSYSFPVLDLLKGGVS